MGWPRGDTAQTGPKSFKFSVKPLRKIVKPRQRADGNTAQRPLVALRAKWDAIVAQCDDLLDRGEAMAADVLSLRLVEIEDRIAEMVPMSPAGAAVQVRLLRQWGDFDWGEPHELLTDKLLTGLARIAGARP